MLTMMNHLWDLVYRSMLLNIRITSIIGMVLDYCEYGDSNCKQVAPFNGGMLVHSDPKGFGVLRMNVKYMETKYIRNGSRRLIIGMN